MDKYAVLFNYFRQCPYLKNLMSIASESNKGNTVILPQGASPAVQYQEQFDYQVFEQHEKVPFQEKSVY